MICFLGEPYIYQNCGDFTRKWGIDLVSCLRKEVDYSSNEIRLQFLLSLTPFRFIMKIGTLLSHSKKVMRTRQELI